MPVSPRTQKLIWGLFAGRCAMCRKSVLWKGETGATSLVGEIAHIVGAKVSAARGRSKPIGGKDEPENLMLLCRQDHKIVDDNEAEYPPGRLHSIRSDYLAWLQGQLAQPRPWSVGIRQYAYLNVPRLDELAALMGYRIPHEPLEGGKHLSSLDYDLNYLIDRFRTTLERLPLETIAADDIHFAHEGYIGQAISFDRLRFRTRNIPQFRPIAGATRFTGSPEHDPHIYHPFPEWRFVINVDPRWITTDTAYGLFRPSGGSSVLSGFARINSVDYEQKIMVATGLAIGLPPSVMDAPEQTATGTPERETIDLSQFEDDVTKSLGREWTGGVSSCQVCGKIFNEGDYMVDGPPKRGGPWGNICDGCFLAGDRRLGNGYGQLYRKHDGQWLMVGGYPVPDANEEFS